MKDLDQGKKNKSLNMKSENLVALHPPFHLYG